MLTYSDLKLKIKNIEDLIKDNKYQECVQKITDLKRDFIEFLENFYPILGDIENKKISFSVYKILFQIVSELALDIEVFYSDVIQDNSPRKSRLSIILEKINLEKDKEWFSLVNEIITEIMHFIEYHYEGYSNNSKYYYLSKEEIQKKIEELKQKI